MTDSNEIENSGELDPRFENFAAYILDALDDEEERAAVEALVEADSAARAEFDELTEAATLLAIAVPPVAPPASLKARILELATGGTAPVITPAAPIPSIQIPRSTTRWSRIIQ